MLTTFEGQVRQHVHECVILSHYHNGITYDDALYMSPFEKQVISDFIEEEMERESEMRTAMAKARMI